MRYFNASGMYFINIRPAEKSEWISSNLLPVWMNTQTILSFFSLMEQFTHLRATWTSFGDMEFLSYHHRCNIMKEEFQLYVGVGARPSTCRNFKYIDNTVNLNSITLMDANPGKNVSLLSPPGNPAHFSSF